MSCFFSLLFFTLSATGRISAIYNVIALVHGDMGVPAELVLLSPIDHSPISP